MPGAAPGDIVRQLATLDPANTWKGLEWWKRWSEACAREQKWNEDCRPGEPRLRPEDVGLVAEVRKTATYNAPWHSDPEAAPRVTVSFAGNLRRANADSLEEQRLARRSLELFRDYPQVVIAPGEWTEETKAFWCKHLGEDLRSCAGYTDFYGVAYNVMPLPRSGVGACGGRCEFAARDFADVEKMRECARARGCLSRRHTHAFALHGSNRLNCTPCLVSR